MKLWDIAAGRQVAALSGHREWITAIGVSPNGNLLVSGSFDSELKFWETATRREIAHLPDALTWIAPLLFSPDGRRLATIVKGVVTVAEGNAVVAWDVKTRRRAAFLKGESGAYGTLAFTPDGKTYAASSGNTISLWNFLVQQKVATLQEHQSVINALAFSPNGDTLASASSDGTVRLWRASPFPETDPLSLVASGSDGTVTLEWRPPPHAMGFNVYRGPAVTPRSSLIRLTSLPVGSTSFTDRDLSLVNGRPQSYAVAPLYEATGAAAVEGPRVMCQASPVGVPSGFRGCSLNEAPQAGSVRFDPSGQEILLRGSGHDFWGDTDGGYVVVQPVEADCRITIQALEKPANTNPWAKAGLMIRESLDPGARRALLCTTAAQGLAFHVRPTADYGCMEMAPSEPTALRLPVTLRLIRQGDTIRAEVAREAGNGFQPFGASWRFEPPLARALFVGMAITSHDRSRTTQARFRDLTIERLPRP